MPQKRREPWLQVNIRISISRMIGWSLFTVGCIEAIIGIKLLLH